jgi:thymidylate synthase
MIAMLTGLEARLFVWSGGDVHLYDNHFEQAKEWLSRRYLAKTPPTLEIKKRKSIDDFVPEDFKLVGYKHEPYIKAQVAV